MSEYIEREALMRNLKQFAPEQLTPLIENLIQKQPTADVVEVVRCKDCKHFEHIYDEFCKNWYQCKRRGNFSQKKPDDFCSYGERKEGNDNA